jgi:hypothetical protein
MSRSERTDSTGGSNWLVTLTGCIGAGAGVALAFWVGKLAELSGFWPGAIAVAIGAGLGGFLGRLVGANLSRRPPRK